MYKVIGADGNEYGPVSREELLAWAKQGRVGAQTRVRPEAGGDWQPLSAFPDLNAAVNVPPVSRAIHPPSTTERASSKVAAGVCGILLGWLGIHKFILGYTTSGVIMLLVCVVGGILTCGVASSVMWVIGLIEGIIYLTKSDEEFVRIYVDGRKEWF